MTRRLVLDHYAQFCDGQEGHGVESEQFGSWPKLNRGLEETAYGRRRLLGWYVYPLDADGRIGSAARPHLSSDYPGQEIQRTVRGRLGTDSGAIVGDFGVDRTTVRVDNKQAGPFPIPYCGRRVRMRARRVRAARVRDGVWRLSGPYGTESSPGVIAAGRLIGMDSYIFAGPPNYPVPFPVVGTVLASCSAISVSGTHFPPQDGGDGFNSGWLVRPDGRFQVRIYDYSRGPFTPVYPLKTSVLSIEGASCHRRDRSARSTSPTWATTACATAASSRLR